MSRKDERRVMLVPLSRDEIAYLRALARGGSLADALRRVVAAAPDLSMLPDRPEGWDRRLPVQLPKTERARVAGAAQNCGWAAPDIVRAALIMDMQAGQKNGKRPRG